MDGAYVQPVLSSASLLSTTSWSTDLGTLAFHFDAHPYSRLWLTRTTPTGSSHCNWNCVEVLAEPPGESALSYVAGYSPLPNPLYELVWSDILIP